MFLLIQCEQIIDEKGYSTLHSNMFLLILVLVRVVFFFVDTLHSNMFLLIQVLLSGDQELPFDFTFQYVSINTRQSIYPGIRQKSLHSNMFLLIPAATASVFVFVTSLHSNMFLLIQFEETEQLELKLSLHSNMFLLIRACQS